MDDSSTSAGGMIMPDVSDGLPQGDPGSGQRLISSRQRTSKSASMGVFRTRCEFSHMNFDDPIVFPGRPGASHLHAYFGNTRADSTSTSTSIASTGNSTCSGGILNRTGYWVPSVIDARTLRPVAPHFSMIYYRSGGRGVSAQAIKLFPNGLRMIAGSAKATSAKDNPEIEWACKTKGATDAEGESSPSIPSDCVRGDVLRLRVKFPQCWDGKNVDSPDHKSHMAYPDSGCPDSHPVALPMIVMNVVYEIDDPSAVDHWRLVSDMYDQSLPGGMSAHADWFNGWDRATADAWLTNCVRAGKDCGKDNLNDGTGLDRP